MSKKERNFIVISNEDQNNFLNDLCSNYIRVKQNLDFTTKELNLTKDAIKHGLDENVDYITSKYRIVISITPSKTEFKYDIDKILALHPELKENEAFGHYETKSPVKAIKDIKELKQ